MENKYDDIYDMIIIGGGPAGLAAAIYMARAKYKTLVVEKEKFGGQITITDEIINYPGVKKTSGTELTKSMQQQAQSFGATFKLCEVLDINLDNDIKVLKTTKGDFKALSIILALGASPRKARFKGEDEFIGRGVAYCATCDGEFFTNKPVYVVGGGIAAVEESMFLTKYATSVNLIVKDSDFNCPKTIVDQLDEYPNIKVYFNTEIKSITGKLTPVEINLENNKTNSVVTNNHEDGFGVFVFAGYLPNTGWLNGVVKTTNNYIVTNDNQETNKEGVYAAGDVCVKDLRQVVTAVSDGAKAATTAEKYIATLHRKLAIPAFEVTKGKPVVEDKEKTIENEDTFLSSDIIEQLKLVFEKLEDNVIIEAVLNESPLSLEMKNFIREFDGMSDKIICKTTTNTDIKIPYFELFNEKKQIKNIKFFTMPGGHEFNSFILTLYSLSTGIKDVNEEDLEKLNQIDDNIDIKVAISLSCTLCPDVVRNTTILSILNDNISTSIIDISQNPRLKEDYNIMSVPCLIINNKSVNFGKKSISQIIDLLK